MPLLDQSTLYSRAHYKQWVIPFIWKKISKIDLFRLCLCLPADSQIAIKNSFMAYFNFCEQYKRAFWQTPFHLFRPVIVQISFLRLKLIKAYHFPRCSKIVLESICIGHLSLTESCDYFLNAMTCLLSTSFDFWWKIRSLPDYIHLTWQFMTGILCCNLRIAMAIYYQSMIADTNCMLFTAGTDYLTNCLGWTLAPISSSTQNCRDNATKGNHVVSSTDNHRVSGLEKRAGKPWSLGQDPLQCIFPDNTKTATKRKFWEIYVPGHDSSDCSCLDWTKLAACISTMLLTKLTLKLEDWKLDRFSYIIIRAVLESRSTNRQSL